ncbi:MAG TPA: L-threonylcarbamoyladenylate synthase [Bauldia sp.]|nr:L-threonylcarbamoyladenylate synthase [Bauldia sp.]
MGSRILGADDPAAIAEAVTVLRAGALVGMPTETVYGLAGDAMNPAAVARIFAAKGRPQFNPLIVHVASLAAAARIGNLGADAQKLGAAFWPGPLTLVVPGHPQTPIAELATAGLSTVAIRIPSHPVAQALLAAFGGPVVAPSANRSGHVSATTAAHVADDLAGSVALILDAGPSEVGVESTIVGLAGDRPLLLRAGAIPREAVEAVLGGRLAEPAGVAAPQAPGMLASHYAPRAAVRLNATDVRAGEALLAFGPAPAGATRAAAIVNLSEKGDLIEAAANLFAALRTLDARAESIAVMPIPPTGLGEAINDRLRRAAAPRPPRASV